MTDDTATRAEARRALRARVKEYDTAYTAVLKAMLADNPKVLRKAMATSRRAGAQLQTTLDWSKVNRPDLSPPARRSLRLHSLSEAQRERLAPFIVPGLTGRARQTFIETGMNIAEQLAHAAATLPPETMEWVEGEATRLVEHQDRLLAAGRKRRGRKGAKQPSAADLARSLGANPREFRQFLRKLGLGAGKGKRAEYTAEQIDTIKSKWNERSK